MATLAFKRISIMLMMSSIAAYAGQPIIISHAKLNKYTIHGNSMTGIATRSLGSLQTEIWRASIAAGNSTPKHVHDADEIFIVLEGNLIAVVEGREYECNSPCTMILPAHTPHIVKNEDYLDSDHLVILPVASSIKNHEDIPMRCPWRH